MDRTFELQGLQFEWDEDQYAVNLRRHRIKFEEAAEVFLDQFGVYDDEWIEGERREYVIGFSSSAKVLFVVFVERAVRMRIVSARLATPHERKDYAEKNFGK